MEVTVPPEDRGARRVGGPRAEWVQYLVFLRDLPPNRPHAGPRGAHRRGVARLREDVDPDVVVAQAPRGAAQPGLGAVMPVVAPVAAEVVVSTEPQRARDVAVQVLVSSVRQTVLRPVEPRPLQPREAVEWPVHRVPPVVVPPACVDRPAPGPERPPPSRHEEVARDA